jgi:hypothetical protein
VKETEKEREREREREIERDNEIMLERFVVLNVFVRKRGKEFVCLKEWESLSLTLTLNLSLTF